MDRSAEQRGDEPTLPSQNVEAKPTTHASLKGANHQESRDFTTASLAEEMPTALKNMTTIQQAVASEELEPRCYLLELPPELRVRIYHFFITSSRPYGTRIGVDPWLEYDLWSVDTVRCWWNPHDRNKSDLALLRTCRLIHSEAAPVIYGSFVFDHTFPSDPYSPELPVTLDMWELARFVRRVCICVGTPDREEIFWRIDRWCDMLSRCRHTLNMSHIQVRLTLKSPEDADQVRHEIKEIYEGRRSRGLIGTLEAQIWAKFMEAEQREDQ
jgi:hypothetical protein